jgi:glycosyltransferase involved in cell wall biosynthesis
MIPRWTRLPLVGGAERARLGDRLTGRLWDYPRWLASRAADFDVFHIIDHSYAHLVRVLPPERTIVTCNDVDAIQPALSGRSKRLDPAWLLASHVLDGLAKVVCVACISKATRAQLLESSRIDGERVTVVYLGVHPACSPLENLESDAEIDRLLGPVPSGVEGPAPRRVEGQKRIEILHVGSTIPRKRIDVLLEIVRGLRHRIDGIRLVRVGGPFTESQRAMADRLGISDSLIELPFLSRPLLAAMYRRAALVVLPSDREGFGLPVVEAMACGTPVVASSIPALREVGGTATTYCVPGEIPGWVDAIAALIRQKQMDPHGWEARRQACLTAAARFDWSRYAAKMTELYAQVAIAARPELARTHAS